MMAANEMERFLCSALDERGYRTRILPVDCAAELRHEIEHRRSEGAIDSSLYKDYLAGFEFDITDRLPGARSIIVTAAPQPQRKVTFHFRGRSYSLIIPPTYYGGTDDEISGILRRALDPHGYRLHRAALPLKLLVARCGMAEYGRNNITYVEGTGSFVRLRAFLSDMPASSVGDWQQPRLLKVCDACRACLTACPAGAIVPDRFLIHAERCITFFNEAEEEFPQWIDPSWHNSLIGCMKCQLVCPANNHLAGWVEEGEAFDETETEAILDGVPIERLQPETVGKLKRGYMLADLAVMPRNLRTLLR
jgi:epoxyqueuosine reductase